MAISAPKQPLQMYDNKLQQIDGYGVSTPKPLKIFTMKTGLRDNVVGQSRKYTERRDFCKKPCLLFSDGFCNVFYIFMHKGKKDRLIYARNQKQMK